MPGSARYLDNLPVQSDAHTADRVRQLILALLPSGRCTVDQVARHLGLDRRTIHRHLGDRDETFSAILSSLREDMAARHLDDSDRPVGEIAELLGFSASSAFARWFRGRFGMTAAAWRRRTSESAPRIRLPNPRAPSKKDSRKTTKTNVHQRFRVSSPKRSGAR